MRQLEREIQDFFRTLGKNLIASPEAKKIQDKITEVGKEKQQLKNIK